MRFGTWKRAFVALTLLAFFLGTAGQAFSGIVTAPRRAMTMMSLDDVASAEDACEAMPAAPICISVIGCISSVGVANTTTPDRVAFDWAVVQYWDLAPLLDRKSGV